MSTGNITKMADVQAYLRGLSPQELTALAEKVGGPIGQTILAQSRYILGVECPTGEFDFKCDYEKVDYDILSYEVSHDYEDSPN